jgi:hypothetical protein
MSGVAVVTSALPAAAITDSCGGLCSGADSASTTNEQGNPPQLYIGQVGNAVTDFSGVGSDTTYYYTDTAQGALTRRTANTGLGIAFYYFTYGPGDKFGYTGTAFCWGYYQGYKAVTDLATYHSSQASQMGRTWMAMDMDVESGEGWGTGTNDRQTFDGFFDYMEGEANNKITGAGAPGSGVCDTLAGAGNPIPAEATGETFQPALYANPETWYTNLGGSSASSGTLDIFSTPVWTNEPDCQYSGQPETLSPAETWTDYGTTPDWPTWTDHTFGWQYDPTGCAYSGSQDWDTSASPQYLPFFGTYLY